MRDKIHEAVLMNSIREGYESTASITPSIGTFDFSTLLITSPVSLFVSLTGTLNEAE